MPNTQKVETFGSPTLFEGQEFVVHEVGIGAGHALLRKPLQLHQEVVLSGRAVVTAVTHDAKGNRVHKLEWVDAPSVTSSKDLKAV